MTIPDTPMVCLTRDEFRECIELLWRHNDLLNHYGTLRDNHNDNDDEPPADFHDDIGGPLSGFLLSPSSTSVVYFWNGFAIIEAWYPMTTRAIPDNFFKMDRPQWSRLLFTFRDGQTRGRPPPDDPTVGPNL